MSDTDNNNPNNYDNTEYTGGTSNYGTPDNTYGTPTGNYGTPDNTYGTPNSNYGTPDNTYGTPNSNYGTPDNTYDTPNSNYGTPDNTYGTPNSNYGTPDNTYDTPNSNYGTPDNTYGTPNSNYGTPDNTYGTPTGNYGTPDNTYGTPNSNYGTPDNTYGTPNSNYGTPNYETPNYGTPDSNYGTPNYGTPDNNYGTPDYGTPDSSYGSTDYNGAATQPGYNNNTYAGGNNGNNGFTGNTFNNNSYNNDYGMSFQDAYVSNGQTTPVKPKKKGKGKIFLIIIPIVLIIAALAVFAVSRASAIKNFFYKTVLSSTDYYKMVEKDSIDKSAVAFGNQYDDMLYKIGGLNNKGCEADISIEVDESGKPYINMLGSFLNVKLDWLDQVGFTTKLSSKDGEYSLSGTTRLNNNDIMTYYASYFSDNKTLYAGIPELSDKYVSVHDNSGVDYREIIMTVDSLVAAMPDKSVMEDLVRRYSNVIVDNIDDVQTKDANISAGGVSQSCTEYVVTLDSAKLKLIIDKLLEEVKNDENIKDILTKNYDGIVSVLKSANVGALNDLSNKIPDMSGETLYNYLMVAIDDVRAKISSASDDGSVILVFSTYIDGSGNIVGRKFVLGNNEISILMPVSGSDFGFEFACHGDNLGTAASEVACTGNGTISGGKLSGDFTMTLPNKGSLMSGDNTPNTMAFTITDLDLDAIENGYVNGKIKYNIGSLLGRMGNSMLDGMSVEYGMTSERDGGTAEIVLYMMDSRMMSLKCSAKLTGPDSANAPNESDVINVDDMKVDKWASTVNPEKVIGSLQSAGMDESVLQHFRKFFDGFSQKNLIDILD